jgi:tRNA threonylcarbamoyladenosine biosynthesis protein TsaE
MKQTLITNSLEETQALSADLARKIDSVSVLALYGDLGSGKTTFIQGLARGLNIEKKIISPTFIIMRTYKLPEKVTKKKFFYHVDLYRVGNKKDIQELGLIELMQDPQNLFAIEWPEKIKDLLPQKRLDIFFEYLDENKRKITYEK